MALLQHMKIKHEDTRGQVCRFVLLQNVLSGSRVQHFSWTLSTFEHRFLHPIKSVYAWLENMSGRDVSELMKNNLASKNRFPEMCTWSL